jgi:hypothetical protein
MGSTEWPQMLNGAVWGPPVAMFLLRVLRLESPARNAAFAGAALGAAFLSGHHQAPTFIALAAAGIWIYGLALHRARMAAPIAAFGSLFLLVGALQILPAWEYGRLAVRWVGSAHDPVGWKEPVPYAVHSMFGLGPASLAGILVPTIARHANPYIGVMLASLALAGSSTASSMRSLRWWRRRATLPLPSWSFIWPRRRWRLTAWTLCSTAQLMPGAGCAASHSA